VSYTPRYDKGNWKADCDVCGRTYKASELQKRWDGLMCCRHDWEIRQPQDFVRGVADTQIAPWTRPEPTDSFVPITFSEWFVNTLTSISSLVLVITRGFSWLSITSVTTTTLNYFKKTPVAPGARQVNGSSINSNSIG
jgi:hypothetical protein